MSDSNVLLQDDDIDVVGLFGALLKRWWIIFLITIITMIGLFLLLSSIDPRYESNARIIIENKNNSFNRTLADTGGQQSTDRFDEQAIRSQVEIISSDRIALEIIAQLNLDSRNEFFEQGLFDKIADFFDSKGANKNDAPINSGQELTSRQSEVLKEFKKRLTVYPIEKSRAIVIEYWSTDPKLAQTVPNRIAQQYVKIQEDKKKTLTREAKVWLDPVVNEYRQKLEEAESEVAAFRSNQDIIQSGTTDQSLATQQLSEISTELSRLRTERSSAQAKVASIRAAIKSGASLDAIPEVIDSNLIQRLREREADIRAQISDLSTTLLPTHPRLRALNSQVDDFEIQIRSAANNIMKSLENNVNLTRESEADLLKEIDRLKQEVARVNKQEVRLDALVRKADSYRELLSEYEKRNLEALSRSNFTPIDAEVYPSQAIPADPYFPKVVPFTIAGTVAAFVLSVLGVLAVTLISGINAGRNAKSDGVAEIVSEEPVIEVVSNEIEAEGYVGEPRKNSPFAQLEKIIAGQSNKLGIRNNIIPKKADDEASKADVPEPSLANNSEDKPSKEANSIAVRYASSVFQDIGEGRIIVTSPGGERGSKTTWILARQLAASNDNGVVVIDLSGDGATAKAMLGGNDLPGIFNLISGAVSATNIIYRDQKSGAHIVPAGTLFEGQPGPDPQTLSDVIDAIAMSYDFCIVDCGDADIEEIEVVATDDSIIIISGINARLKQCKQLEDDLKQDGFTDILHIIPDQEDVEKESEPLLA